MKTYDDVVGFDYTSTEEWLNFIRNQVLPLHRSITKIVKLRRRLEELLRHNLHDLIKGSENIRQILLGGVDENGDYKPNSLAKVYKEFLGVSIDTKEYVSLSKHGVDVAEYIKKPNFTKTTFLELIEEARKITSKLLPLAGVNAGEAEDSEIKDILEDPEKIVKELSEIYTRLVSISANHSYHTFFTINTRCIPRYYIERAYPKLKEKFEEVAKFLGLKPLFTPDTKEEEIRRGYTLWGHKEGGLADLLYELNKIIWEYFKKEEFRKIWELFTDARDLEREYLIEIESALDGINWKFPDYINPHSWRDYDKGPYWHEEYEIDGVWLSKCYEVPSWQSRKEREVKFEGRSLIELFNDISPALLLGYISYKHRCHILKYSLAIKGNRLSITTE